MLNFIVLGAIWTTHASDYRHPPVELTCEGALRGNSRGLGRIKFAHDAQVVLKVDQPMTEADVKQLISQVKKLWKECRPDEDWHDQEIIFRFWPTLDHAGRRHGEIYSGDTEPSCFRISVKRFRRLLGFAADIAQVAPGQAETNGMKLKISSVVLRYQPASDQSSSAPRVRKKFSGEYFLVMTKWRGLPLIAQPRSGFYPVPLGQSYLFAGLSYAGHERAVWLSEPLLSGGENLGLDVGLEPEPYNVPLRAEY